MPHTTTEIHVILIKKDSSWIAQGIQHDIVANAEETPNAAKDAFLTALRGVINENFQAVPGPNAQELNTQRLTARRFGDRECIVAPDTRRSVLVSFYILKNV